LSGAAIKAHVSTVASLPWFDLAVAQPLLQVRADGRRSAFAGCIGRAEERQLKELRVDADCQPQLRVCARGVSMVATQLHEQLQVLTAFRLASG
jgi:hypothetical protein